MAEPSAAELAVIIVNYNAGGYLERCLASIEEHRGDVELDVLVIDNASGDGSHTAAAAAHPSGPADREVHRPHHPRPGGGADSPSPRYSANEAGGRHDPSSG